MPRRKDYRIAADHVSINAFEGWSGTGPLVDESPGNRTPSDADIDVRAVIGADARMPGLVRTIKLSPALGRGIDPWVFASADAIRALLRYGRSPSTCDGYKGGMLHFFSYLTDAQEGISQSKAKPLTPHKLSPIHVIQFIEWIKKKGREDGWSLVTVRWNYSAVKGVLEEMFAQGLIEGDPSRFFKRGSFQRESGSTVTGLSDAEQVRISAAIKADLSNIHHGRLTVTMREVQALRFLVVAHRMGHNLTPLLELSRDAVQSGLLPGTILLRTTKYRSRKIMSHPGRSGVPLTPTSEAPVGFDSEKLHETPARGEGIAESYLPFGFAEGAVIQQAIAASNHLLETAPKTLKNRVWLYAASQNLGRSVRKGDVSCLTANTVGSTIRSVVTRHSLVGDDGKPLKVTISRLRKSRFDRINRIADGDLAISANLMGNTPAVAATNYPSMNYSRQAEAAEFMNSDYVATMRGRSSEDMSSAGGRHPMRVVQIQRSNGIQTPTPVSGCTDSLGGEHAPRNGSPCDRFVMCLFCSNFAVAGTVDELWRLFSFQTFGKAELEHLDASLGSSPAGDEPLVELRDRYRLAIQHIDDFTKRQFAPSRVSLARSKTAAGLHPFWQLQMKLSARGRRGK